MAAASTLERVPKGGNRFSESNVRKNKDLGQGFDSEETKPDLSTPLRAGQGKPFAAGALN
jgi:hypothetical protein